MPPLFAAGTCLMLGVLAGIRLEGGLLWRWLALAAAAGAAGLCFFLRRDSRFFRGSLCFVFFFLGMLQPVLRPSAPARAAALLGRPVTVEGRIVPGSYRYDPETRYASFLLAAPPGRIRVGLVRAEPWPLPYGSVSVRGVLKAVPAFYNFGLPRTEERTAAAGICGVIRTEAALARRSGTELTLREKIHALGPVLRKPLRLAASRADSAVLEGMLFGGKEGIPPGTVRLFSQCGLSHLLSVSGSHVALLLGFLFSFLELVRAPRLLRVGAVTVCLGAYAVICGLQAPVCRAALLGCGSAWGLLFRRRAGGTAFLGFAALVFLAVDPYWCLDLGFQLSFGAAAGLMLFRRTLEERLIRCLPGFLARPLSVTLAAQILILPVLIRNFHALSAASLLANTVVTPLLGACLAGTLGGTGLFPFWEPAGRLLLAFSAQLLGLAMAAAERLAALPGSVWVTGRPAPWALCCYILFIGSIFRLLPVLRTGRTLRKCLLVLSLGGLGLAFLYPRFQSRPLEVYFLDVGQGDSALVVTPRRRTILIDSGGLPGHFDVGDRIIVPFLRSLGVSSLDVLLLSHGHHDHAGGAAAVAASLPVRTVLLPDEPASRDVERLLGSLADRGRSVRIETMRTRSEWKLDGTRLSVIHAGHSGTGESGNESSAIVLVESCGHKILFTGDATGEIELAAAAGPIGCDVLKVSHHGSRTSSEMEFLRRANPSLAVISAGRENRFGHPHQEVLERFRTLSVPVARTDAHGAVKISFDAKKLSWYSCVGHLN